MISKETFCSKLEEKVRELNPKASVTILEAQKVNGVKTGIACTVGEEVSISKTVYYEDYMDADGRFDFVDLDTLITRVAEMLLSSDGEGEHYASMFFSIKEDKDQFLAHTHVCLLNSANEGLAYCEKSERFEGLIESYYIKIESASVWVTKQMLDYLDISVEELRDAAFANIFKKTKITGMMDVLTELTSDTKVICEDDNKFKEDPTGMYVVSNVERFRGAICAENIEKLAEYLGDDLYILPSSIHEMIAVPVHMNGDVGASTLLSMVEEVNATQVEADERLIDAVYEYSKETKSYRRVA